MTESFTIGLVRQAPASGELIELYREAGWWDDAHDRPELVGGIVAGSWRFVIATETASGRIAGMGRIISDGVSDAYIQDVMVRQAFRRQGLGRAIVARLLDECHDGGVRSVYLLAEPGSESVYAGLGFRPLPFLGMKWEPQDSV